MTPYRPIAASISAATPNADNKNVLKRGWASGPAMS
jgi:hypothetical protein